MRRDLFAIELQNDPFPEERVNELRTHDTGYDEDKPGTDRILCFYR